jgi:hypothetical protein
LSVFPKKRKPLKWPEITEICNFWERSSIFASKIILIMQRKILDLLITWKNMEDRKPLILNGTSQAGK